MIFLADCDEIGLACKTPIVHLDSVESATTTFRFTDKSLVNIEGLSELFLGEIGMHPNIAEQFRENSVFRSVDAFPRHRSTLGEWQGKLYVMPVYASFTYAIYTCDGIKSPSGTGMLE